MDGSIQGWAIDSIYFEIPNKIVHLGKNFMYLVFYLGKKRGSNTN